MVYDNAGAKSLLLGARMLGRGHTASAGAVVYNADLGSELPAGVQGGGGAEANH